jgi:hypothetical protein
VSRHGPAKFTRFAFTVTMLWTQTLTLTQLRCCGRDPAKFTYTQSKCCGHSPAKITHSQNTVYRVLQSSHTHKYTHTVKRAQALHERPYAAVSPHGPAKLPHTESICCSPKACNWGKDTDIAQGPAKDTDCKGHRLQKPQTAKGHRLQRTQSTGSCKRHRAKTLLASNWA